MKIMISLSIVNAGILVDRTSKQRPKLRSELEEDRKIDKLVAEYWDLTHPSLERRRSKCRTPICDNAVSRDEDRAKEIKDELLRTYHITPGQLRDRLDAYWESKRPSYLRA